MTRVRVQGEYGRGMAGHVWVSLFQEVEKVGCRVLASTTRVQGMAGVWQGVSGRVWVSLYQEADKVDPDPGFTSRIQIQVQAYRPWVVWV